jgi:uncharacterized protein (DUF1684 family)
MADLDEKAWQRAIDLVGPTMELAREAAREGSVVGVTALMTFAFSLTGQVYLDVIRQYKDVVDTLIGTSDEDCLITEQQWQDEATEWLKRLHADAGRSVKPDWVYSKVYDASLKMARAIRVSGQR